MCFTGQIESCYFGRRNVSHEALHPQVNEGTTSGQQLLHLSQALDTHRETSVLELIQGVNTAGAKHTQITHCSCTDNL